MGAAFHVWGAHVNLKEMLGYRDASFRVSAILQLIIVVVACSALLVGMNVPVDDVVHGGSVA